MEDGHCVQMTERGHQNHAQRDGGHRGDARRDSNGICCHDSKRIVPWTLFSSCLTLTIVLLVLFLVFKDDHHLEDNDPLSGEGQQNGALKANVTLSSCGLRSHVRHQGIDIRVSGGRASDIESWPWMASLRTERGKHFCGATLINERWLLTAAHCIHPSLSLPLGSIVFGDSSLAEQSEYHEVRYVYESYIHPDFDTATYANDIALVRFDPPVSATDGVSTACLNEGTSEIEDFTKCFVAGWGATSSSDLQSVALQEARVPLVPLRNCSQDYGQRHPVTSNMICAVSTDWQSDTCKGDSGGPLMCEKPASDTWSVIGVTSFGYGCWHPGNPAPGVYTRISSYFNSFIKPTVIGWSAGGSGTGDQR